MPDITDADRERARRLAGPCRCEERREMVVAFGEGRFSGEVKCKVCHLAAEFAAVLEPAVELLRRCATERHLHAFTRTGLNEAVLVHAEDCLGCAIDAFLAERKGGGE